MEEQQQQQQTLGCHQIYVVFGTQAQHGARGAGLERCIQHAEVQHLVGSDCELVQFVIECAQGEPLLVCRTISDFACTLQQNLHSRNHTHNQ